MKITTLLTILTTLQISAAVYSQNTKVSINVKDISLHDIFNEIERQSEFRIFYKIDQIDLEKRYDMQANNENVSDVLNLVLSESNASFKLVGRIIVITPDNTVIQQQKVTGKISDGTTGEALPGVNVLVDGTTIGTVSDENGNYSIDIPTPNSIISFSFVGYLTEKVQVGGQTNIDIKLLQDIKSLEEVVVVGYGTQKKSDVTGSVVSVKADKIMANAPTNIQQALQGKAAGVLITQSGSGVNTDPTIRVRGNRSISAKNDPLFVIDGIPAFDGTNMVNPNDVQSIEILKDASATAIYGSRGANGVILITTKRGEKGKVTVEYNGDFSVGQLSRYRKMMNGEQFMEYQRDINRKYTYDKVGGYAIDPNNGYGSLDPVFAKDQTLTFVQNPYIMESLKQAWSTGEYIPSNLRTFNWQKDGWRDQATSTTHALNVRGGSENTQVFLSGSYMDLKDIQMQSFNKRYTVRLNIDQKVGKKITLGGTVNVSDRQWDGGQWMASYWNPLGTPWYSPDGDVTKAGDPAYGVIPQPCGDNLLYSNYLDLTGAKREDHNNNITLAAFATVNLFKGLSYKVTVGNVINVTNSNRFFGKMTSTTSLGTPRASKESKVSRSWSFENNLSYNTKIGQHSIGATLVQTNEKSIYDQEKLSGTGIPIESQTWHALSAATAQANESSFTQWQLQSYLGRLNYTFMDRYLLTASIRYDGSSRLADGHKWVAFPSLALGWRITEENFMKNITVLDNLKLRAGYGVTGNASVDAYSTIGQIESSRYNWATDVLAAGYIPRSMSNNSLTWEKTSQYNVGLDFGFLRGRISGVIDLYLQNTSDLLMPRTLPSVSGFSSVITNVGETRNKGIEISLTTENVKIKEFSWVSTINFSRNKEELVKLNSGLPNDVDNRWFVGQPIFTYYDYVAAPKVWGYSKEDFDEMAKFNANGHSYAPGQLRLVDLTDDYKITDADRQIRGSRVPKWTASLENTFTYGPFDLYVFMNCAVGHTIYWDPGNVGDGKLNMPEYLANQYWTPERTDTKFIAPTGSGTPGQITAMFYWKGDYLKINDISLGYTLLNNKLLKQIGVQRVRFSMKVLNPFVFTSFPGVDPEGLISNSESVMNGASQRTYGDPGFLMRTYKLGLNVTF